MASRTIALAIILLSILPKNSLKKTRLTLAALSKHAFAHWRRKAMACGRLPCPPGAHASVGKVPRLVGPPFRRLFPCRAGFEGRSRMRKATRGSCHGCCGRGSRMAAGALCREAGGLPSSTCSCRLYLLMSTASTPRSFRHSFWTNSCFSQALFKKACFSIHLPCEWV